MIRRQIRNVATPRRMVLLLALCVALPPIFCRVAHAQATDDSGGHRLVLVLPFQNKSQQPALEWMAEAFPVIMNQRFASAGFLPISREERAYGLDRLGLPPGLHPSRATAYRLAEEMDADYMVLGEYSEQNGKLILDLSLLDVRRAHMPAPMRAQDQVANLLKLGNEMAWRAIKQMDPAYDVPEASFLAAVPQVRLDAFESYVRGLLAANPAERIRHLEAATQLSPDFVIAQFQLGRSYFAAQEYEKAIAELTRVPADHPVAMEAAFYLALAEFYTGRYPQSEQTFSFIATRLPLPEVLNNEGVAASRHGKDGTPLFQQAVTADPKDEDFHFNLAVSLRRSGDFQQAGREVQAALALRPNDAEAKTLQGLVAALQRAVPEGTDDEASGPLERLKRDFNEATIRQAAFALEEIEQAKLSAQPSAQRSAAQAADGDRYASQGLLLEAEESYQAALRTNSQDAAAHAGLANVRLKTGDLAAARAEAESSLKLAPNAPAYVVLAGVAMGQNQLPAAAQAVTNALRLQPQDKTALRLRQTLQQRGVAVP